jgi:hypothetical protein
MTQFYDLTNFIVKKFEEHPLIHTVVFGKINVRDIAKMNIFPLVHITPMNIIPGNQVTVANFEIAVVTNRNSVDQYNINKISNDNAIDNLNECFAILNTTIFDIKNNYNDNDIEITSDNQAEPVLFEEKNLLDGWVVEVTFEIPNNEC